MATAPLDSARREVMKPGTPSTPPVALRESELSKTFVAGIEFREAAKEARVLSTENPSLAPMHLVSRMDWAMTLPSSRGHVTVPTRWRYRGGSWWRMEKKSDDVCWSDVRHSGLSSKLGVSWSPLMC